MQFSLPAATFLAFNILSSAVMLAGLVLDRHLLLVPFMLSLVSSAADLCQRVLLSTRYGKVRVSTNSAL